MDTKLKLILLITIFLLNPVSAKFICGEVESTTSVTPSWYSVKTYLASNENYFSTCQVSPSNSRYCCDLDIIKDKTGYNWKAEDTFKTKITDIKSGYFASPKNLTLTAEGYDIAPTLTLEKAIKLTSPKTTLTISKTTIPIQTNISKNCINPTYSQTNLTLGKNSITITATCNEKQFVLNETLFVVQNITFQKEYSKEFKSKSKPKIRNSRTGTISLKTKLSHPVEKISLKEYVPSSWEISNISNNATVKFSTPEYNVITWELNGKDFEFSYKAKAPKIKFWPEYYNFETTIDNQNLSQNKVQVHKIFPIPYKQASSGGGGSAAYKPKELSKVSPEFPLIFEEDDLSSALYSNIPKEEEAFNLLSFLYEGKLDKNFDFIKYYKVQTTLNPNEKGKMVFEYEVNKTLLDENNYKEIGFFEKQKGKFLRITGGVIASNEDSIKYRFESEEPLDEFFILAEKNKTSLWNKILNILNKAKFW